MANEPDIVQKLSVDFNVVNNISVDIDNSQPMRAQMNSDPIISANFNSDSNISAIFNSNTLPLDVQLGTVYLIGGCKVLYASTATWNSKPQLISDRGYIYIYSDYRKNEQEQNVAAMKVGDGMAYLIDLPFTDQLLYDHIEDVIRHITQTEREFWNDKIRCYIDNTDNEHLIFTTQ